METCTQTPRWRQNNLSCPTFKPLYQRRSWWTVKSMLAVLDKRFCEAIETFKANRSIQDAAHQSPPRTQAILAAQINLQQSIQPLRHGSR